MAKEELGVSCELIDLQTIIPWDEETVIKVLYTEKKSKPQENWLWQYLLDSENYCTHKCPKSNCLGLLSTLWILV